MICNCKNLYVAESHRSCLIISGAYAESRGSLGTINIFETFQLASQRTKEESDQPLR